MKVRIRRFYYEELEEIIENITDKIAEIDDYDDTSEYSTDRKTALTLLRDALDELGGRDV